jgi:hypothetical protein
MSNLIPVDGHSEVSTLHVLQKGNLVVKRASSVTVYASIR